MRKSVAALLLIASLLVCFQAFRVGASGFHAQRAHREVERWTPALSRRPIDAVQADLRESLRYAPASASALNLQGTVELAKMRGSNQPSAAVASAERAKVLFRRALQERPTSPFLWANLALAKMYLDEQDTEMLAALKNADALGPWEPRVQEATVFVGLAAWSKLDSGLRDSVARAVERAARYNANTMLSVLKSYGRLDLACGLARYHGIAGASCETTKTSGRKQR